MPRRRSGVPRPPDIRLDDLSAGASGDLVNGADLDGVEFTGLPPEPVALRDASVVTCRLVDVGSPEVDLRGATIRETELLRPDFTITQAWRGRWTDVRVEELDLSDSTIRRASFDGSHVQSLDLRDARMEHVDLRGSTYDHISGVAHMRGTIVSERQLTELAPLLAAAVGISVS